MMKPISQPLVRYAKSGWIGIGKTTPSIGGPKDPTILWIPTSSKELLTPYPHCMHVREAPFLLPL